MVSAAATFRTAIGKEYGVIAAAGHDGCEDKQVVWSDRKAYRGTASTGAKEIGEVRRFRRCADRVPSAPGRVGRGRRGLVVPRDAEPTDGARAARRGTAGRPRARARAVRRRSSLAQGPRGRCLDVADGFRDVPGAAFCPGMTLRSAVPQLTAAAVKGARTVNAEHLEHAVAELRL